MKKTYNTYISVSATNYSTVPTINSGFMYTTVETCKLKVHTKLSYMEAKKQIAQIAIQHNLQIQRSLNPLDPSIITYSVSGFLD